MQLHHRVAHLGQNAAQGRECLVAALAVCWESARPPQACIVIPIHDAPGTSMWLLEQDPSLLVVWKLIFIVSHCS